MQPTSQSSFHAAGAAEVAIFWDLDHVPIPDGCAAVTAFNCLRDKVLPFGRIVERKLYSDFSQKEGKSDGRSDLRSLGFATLDCPSRKNHVVSLPMMLVVDAMSFAWERVARGAQACVVFVIRDEAFSYALARLRDTGVTTVLVVPSGTPVKVLIDTANVTMVLETEILRLSRSSGPLADVSSTLCAIRKSNVGATKNETLQGFTQLRLTQALLETVLACMESRQQAYSTLRQSWAVEANVAYSFYNRTDSKDKALYVGTRTLALSEGLVILGRRNLGAPQTPIVACNEVKRDGMSKETYLQLTLKGFVRLRDIS